MKYKIIWKNHAHSRVLKVFFWATTVDSSDSSSVIYILPLFDIYSKGLPPRNTHNCEGMCVCEGLAQSTQGCVCVWLSNQLASPQFWVTFLYATLKLIWFTFTIGCAVTEAQLTTAIKDQSKAFILDYLSLSCLNRNRNRTAECWLNLRIKDGQEAGGRGCRLAYLFGTF